MYPASFIPVETIWSADARMSLSVTRSAKKFQLFQPIGGVSATTCGGANRAFGAISGAETAVALEGDCEKPASEARARAASESEAKTRIVKSFLKTISDGILCPHPDLPQFQLPYRNCRTGKARTFPRARRRDSHVLCSRSSIPFSA